MKRVGFSAPTLLAHAMVVSSLGLSLFVSAVRAMADEDVPLKVEAPAVRLPGSSAVVNTIETRPASSDIVRTSHVAAPQVLGVHLSKDGLLTGRLNVVDSLSGARVPAEQLSIKFVQNGRVVTQVKPGPGGVFQASGLTTGAFSVIASGADGLFVTTAVILPYPQGDETADNALATNPYQIDATVVHPSNVRAVRRLIDAASRSPSASATSPKLQRQNLRRNTARTVSDGEADLAPTPMQTPVLTVASDGWVNTRINSVNPVSRERSPAEGATVYLFQRGTYGNRRYRIDENGSFNAKGLVPGHYSLVVISSAKTNSVSGRAKPMFAALGVLVEADSERTATVRTSSRLSVITVSAKTQDISSFTIDLAQAEDYQIAQQTGPDTPMDQNQGQNPDQPLLGGGGGGVGGGGGGFGGGGGGGLGGLGALAGLGGLAGLAALGSNNSSSSSTAASPSSP